VRLRLDGEPTAGVQESVAWAVRLRLDGEPLAGVQQSQRPRRHQRQHLASAPPKQSRCSFSKLDNNLACASCTSRVWERVNSPKSSVS